MYVSGCTGKMAGGPVGPVCQKAKLLTILTSTVDKINTRGIRSAKL